MSKVDHFPADGPGYYLSWDQETGVCSMITRSGAFCRRWRGSRKFLFVSQEARQSGAVLRVQPEADALAHAREISTANLNGPTTYDIHA